MVDDIEAVIRLVAAVLIGLSIGFSRKHKPAGLRTFALFCLGCTIFTLVSIRFDQPYNDPSRVIAQIVTGIGFLGLGVIWRQGIGKPTGLTTAAAIWVTAAIGVLIGLGMWPEVIIGAVLTLSLLYSKEPLKRAHLEE
ncbi:MAG: MgtC/SapB family protein [Candidatus Micrarchaeota archaeon]